MVTLNQFSKLPLFAAHYVDHWQKNHNMSLLNFFEIHYFGTDSEDDDSEQDKQLPLKSVCISAFQTFTAPSIPQIEKVPFVAFKRTISNITKDQFVPTKIIANIFRPPKA